MMTQDIDALIADQAGVISRRQAIARGVVAHDIRRVLRRREWAIALPGVYVNHTGSLSWLQRAWAAVLFSWPAALSHESALRSAEGPGKGRGESTIHVSIDRHRHLVRPPGVTLHRVVGLTDRVLWNMGPPRVSYEHAAIDVAAAAESDFAAIGILAEACQSRRTTARRIVEMIHTRDRLSRREWMTSVLRDVAAGSCSVLEHGYLTKVERAHGLAPARRQVRSHGSSGALYRDVEYSCGLVIELDGRLFHDTARQRDRDFDRDLDAAVSGRDTRRLSWGQVFDRPCWTAARIALLLKQRGWAGRALPCGRDCALRG
jgi:hypothetical protein